MKTKSEILFSEYCARHGYSIEEIAVGSRKTPDFRVSKNDSSCIVEVKEMQPNRADRKFGADLELLGYAEFGEVPGKRIRGILRSAAKQLQAFKDKNLPLIILLYDNIRYNEGLVHAPTYVFDHLGFAMYGDGQVNIEMHADEIKGSTEVRGGNRRFTSLRSTYISAVSVLYDFSGPTRMLTFHNYFARVKCPLGLFSEGSSAHYVCEDDPLLGLPGWVEV